MIEHASGTFDVKLAPQQDAGVQSSDPAKQPTVGRLLLSKQFHGDLIAKSEGQMLAYRSTVNGSAGYVAMEQVAGILRGRSGTFVLQHSGTMNRGAATLDLNVVPDSGTDELAGLVGSMKINIVEGKHFYEFDYEIPAR